jgi:hypothetical protein
MARLWVIDLMNYTAYLVRNETSTTKVTYVGWYLAARKRDAWTYNLPARAGSC